MLKELPIGISDFKKLRVTNHLYVDKTEQIAYFARKSIPLFLSRPRRFGKSLLVSTFKEIFQANRELFKGLWLGQEGRWEWQEHFVLHFDLSAFDVRSLDNFQEGLRVVLDSFGSLHGVQLESYSSHELKLQQLVSALAKKGQVVILIDEYDHPLLFNIGKGDVLVEFREILKNFFAVIKSLIPRLRFLFITGVSKFANTSIFSGMNSLHDISFDEEAADLVGYTPQEVRDYFSDRMITLAQKENCSTQDLLKEITRWYNGYRFSEKDCSVYNPFSLIKLFSHMRFNNYWYATGTPTFLLKLMRDEIDLAQRLSETIAMTEDELGVFDIEKVPALPLLYQAGYLTIKEYRRAERDYLLGIPNLEVRDSLYNNFLAELSHTDLTKVRTLIPVFLNSLYIGDMEKFCKTLQSLLAYVPFHLHIAQEKYYHSLFQLLLTLLGLDAQSEIITDKGRIDMVIEVPAFVHVFEIKFKKKVEEALEQIEDRKYYEKFLLSGKQIILVGLSFGVEGKLLAIEYQIREL